MHRREMMIGLGSLASGPAAAASIPWLSPELPEGTKAAARMVQLPDKQPLLQLTDRPLNLETPIRAFRFSTTATDQFFVRYHLAGAPDAKTLDNWKLEIGGDAAEKPVTLTMTDLNDLPQTDVLAVCQCAGLRRGLVQPHVPGVQWGHGAMGCALWHGPRLRDVLAKAGVKPEAVEIWLDCPDEPVLPGTPRFQKSLPLTKAMADETIVATSINGAPLPIPNGYPARLVVPGWVSTYWMKHITGITISAKPLDSFWMAKAYRVPGGLFPVEMGFPTQEGGGTWPITQITVNSVIASPAPGDQVERSGFTIRGVAWDGGSGILRVDISLDGGKSWQGAQLDRDIGGYAFRAFRLESGAVPRGPVELRVRAVSNKRETQPEAWRANSGGYHNNTPQRVAVTAV